MTMLPMGWAKLSFNQVAEIVTGTTPSTNILENYGKDVPFVTPADLNVSYPITETNVWLSNLGASKARLLPPDTVMVCCIGSLGKVGFAGTTLVTNQQINALTFDKERVFPKYGYHFCKTLKPILEHYAPSTTLPIINKTRFGEFEIPLPPLAEQKRIAAILDKADAIREKRRRAIAKLDELVQSVFIDMFGDPVTNPKGWTEFHLKDLLNFTTGKLDSNAAEEGGLYQFFTCSKDTFLINTYAFDCEALLLAGNNATADYSIKYYKGKFNAYQRTYVITLIDENNSYYYFKHMLEQKLIDLKRLSKGTNTKYLTLSLLNDIKIPVPNQKIQYEYSKLAEKIILQKQVLLKSLCTLDNLFSSLQRRAFSGELSEGGLHSEAYF